MDALHSLLMRCSQVTFQGPRLHEPRLGGAVQTLNNMYHRWTPEMETDFLKQHHWRKSSQWVTLRYVLQHRPSKAVRSYPEQQPHDLMAL